MRYEGFGGAVDGLSASISDTSRIIRETLIELCHTRALILSRIPRFKGRPEPTQKACYVVLLDRALDDLA